MLLRSAQARRKDIRSQNDATAVIGRLEDCLRLLQEGAEKRPAEADLTGQLARIELGLARLDYGSHVAGSDPGKAEAELRQAIRDVQSIVPSKISPDTDRELLRVFHRAMSNVLWFYHRLRTIENARLNKEDVAVIGGNIGMLHGGVFWPTVRFYAETIENLMYGYEMIGEGDQANEMADLIVALLREMANDKRKPGDKRDTTEFLNAEEKEIYLRALEFLQKKHDPTGRRKR